MVGLDYFLRSPDSAPPRKLHLKGCNFVMGEDWVELRNKTARLITSSPAQFSFPSVPTPENAACFPVWAESLRIPLWIRPGSEFFA